MTRRAETAHAIGTANGTHKPLPYANETLNAALVGGSAECMASIPLWHYYDQKVGEIYFLMEGTAGRVIPLEVKSGRKVRSHTALDRLLCVDAYRVSDSVVLSHNNLSREGRILYVRILYVPLYMTFCLDELTEHKEEGFAFAPISI